MSEPPNSGRDTSGDPPPIQRSRTEEPQAPPGQDEPNANVVSDATADDKAPGEPVDPGVGGYAGRDSRTEMPRVPSAPETQNDPGTDDAAPDN